MWVFVALIISIITYNSLLSASSEPTTDRNIKTLPSKTKPKFSSWSTELTPVTGNHLTQNVVDFDYNNHEKFNMADNMSSGGNFDLLRESSQQISPNNYDTRLGQLQQQQQNGDSSAGSATQTLEPLSPTLNLADFGSNRSPINGSSLSLRWPTVIGSQYLDPMTPYRTNALIPLNSLDRIDQLDVKEGPTLPHPILYSNLLKRLPETTISSLSSLLSNLSPAELIAFENSLHAPTRNLLKPSVPIYSPTIKGPWLKALVNRRRSFEPSVDLAPRSVKFNFDDTVEPTRVGDLDNRKTLSSRREYFTALAHQLPLAFDSPSISSKNSKLINDDDQREIVPLMDNLIAGSRYSQLAYHSPPHYSYHYPAYMPQHKIAVTPRKGLEKLVGVPVLIGIGAALISFLIISNLFLSIPLFAMTLMQFLNGNNGMILPNNVMPSNNNSPQTNTPVTPTGRKRRDLHELEFEDRILKAIQEHY